MGYTPHNIESFFDGIETADEEFKKALHEYIERLLRTVSESSVDHEDAYTGSVKKAKRNAMKRMSFATSLLEAIGDQ